MGAGCVCRAGSCEASELVDWWPSFGYFADGFLKQWNAPDRFPVRPSVVAMTASFEARRVYVADGVAHRSVDHLEGEDSFEWVPVPTEDRIRAAHIAYGHGYMIAENDHVYFTDSALTPVWRTDDLGPVAEVCLGAFDNAMVLLRDGRVLATGSNTELLGTNGVVPPEHGFLEVTYPRPVVSLACTGQASIAILDDGTAWFTGPPNQLPGPPEPAQPSAPVPRLADLRLTRRFERAISTYFDGSQGFCVAGSEIAGGYACWTDRRYERPAMVWSALPRLPVEIREGGDGICGRFDVGFGRQEIRCIAGSDPSLVAVLVWSTARIGT
ncbi:MAG: hypothetical protein J0L92_31215 [Deltaproteobacteria bacterium]|nr:hypothetical protein [Deltaproteobacteria bacterium]